MKSKIFLFIVFITCFVSGLVVYNIWFGNDSDEEKTIKAMSYDGKVTFTLFEDDYENVILSSTTQLDSTMVFEVEDRDEFIADQKENNQYYYKDAEDLSSNRVYHLFLYEGYIFSLCYSGTNYLTFTYANFAYFLSDGGTVVFPYPSIHAYAEETDNTVSFDTIDIINDYESGKEFYSNLNDDLVMFDDDNQLIKLKCTDIDNVNVSQQNLTISSGYAIILKFKDNEFEIEFNKSEW